MGYLSRKKYLLPKSKNSKNIFWLANIKIFFIVPNTQESSLLGHYDQSVNYYVINVIYVFLLFGCGKFWRYGKVFKSHIFGSPTIVSTDAEVNRSILQSDAKTFVPFYPKSLTELMGKSSILLINGSLQRRIHGLIGAFFKSPHVKARITHDMQKYVQQSMANWHENCPIYIQDQAKNVSFLFPASYLTI